MAEQERPVRARRVGFEKERGVLAVQTEGPFTFFYVDLGAGQAQDAAALRVLRPLAERGVNIRFFRIHPGSLSFIASDPHDPSVREVLAAADAAFEAAEGCVVVTVVAPNVRSIPGIMARMGRILHASGVHVHQTADSHSSVACVIPGEQTTKAAEALRGEFGLAEEAA